MKNLFEPEVLQEVKERIARVSPESKPEWGKMNPAQMLAHCTAAFDLALGKVRPPREFIGRIVGPLAKRSVIYQGEPMPRNVGTHESLLVADERDFPVETERLRDTIKSFAEGGPAVCTTHPHLFFGPLTPVEWSTLMYQHLDHHLRQFGV